MNVQGIENTNIRKEGSALLFGLRLLTSEEQQALHTIHRDKLQRKAFDLLERHNRNGLERKKPCMVQRKRTSNLSVAATNHRTGYGKIRGGASDMDREDSTRPFYALSNKKFTGRKAPVRKEEHNGQTEID